MRISREEFNQAIGAALSALRVERGFSQAEVAEGINAVPEVERHERGTRTVAAHAALSIILRSEQGLTQEELAKRSQVPLEFVRDLEAGKDANPDFYFLYCLSVGFNLSFTEFAHRAEELSDIPDEVLLENEANEEGEHS
jgi:transcriptional regulator with XRE-family HTH domain